MLTESCVMFFSPSRAVLTAILRDECLTSAARDGEKIMTHVPLPLPRHSFFFLLLSQLSTRTSRGNACYAGYSQDGIGGK